MATLYVENVPDELYEALRDRAKQHRKSITAEVLTLLEESIPSADELKRRKRLLSQTLRLHSRPRAGGESFPSTEEMQREDRAR